MKIPVKFRRVLRTAPGKPFVLKRSDGKYLAVYGWSVEWEEKKSEACPKFRDTGSDWHVEMLRRNVRDCTLEPYDQ